MFVKTTEHKEKFVVMEEHVPLASIKGIINFGFTSYIIIHNNNIFSFVIVHSCVCVRRGPPTKIEKKKKNKKLHVKLFKVVP